MKKEVKVKASKSQFSGLMENVVKRFLRYVAIETTSKEDVKEIPSTACQFDLANLLKKELHELKLKDVRLDKHGYVYATLPASDSKAAKGPVVGLIAHLDTSCAVSGKGVKPVIHKNYSGGDIVLPKDKTQIIRAKKHPGLKKVIGHDIITADGTTLLGADDKAGIAVIMAAVEYLLKHPEIPHGNVKIGFTPDEEVGRGAELFDVKGFGADFAYTLDGECEGELNIETFNAASALVSFNGHNAHPGYAKGIMINSFYAAADFLSRFPKKERPETTEKRQGYFHPYVLQGNEGLTTVKVLLRDFETKGLEDRKKRIKKQVEATRKAFPDTRIELVITDSYKNMKVGLDPYPFIEKIAADAMKAVSVKPEKKPIRGGTDGARLTFMGLPCANIFCGMQTPHSREEWISAQVMGKSAEMLINLVQICLQKGVSNKEKEKKGK